ncbi:MAG: hemin uptake protein HemP [Nitrosospira sp.]
MSSIAHSIMETPVMVSETGADQRKFTLFERKKSIHSDALFSDGDEVYIQHRGEQYLLRRTRNGKLILTK